MSIDDARIQQKFDALFANTSVDPVILDRLGSLFERNVNDIERQQDELDRMYKSIPDVLQKTSKLSGIEPMELITICGQACWHYDIEWYKFLSYIRAFYVVKQRREQEKQEQQPEER